MNAKDAESAKDVEEEELSPAFCIFLSSNSQSQWIRMRYDLVNRVLPDAGRAIGLFT